MMGGRRYATYLTINGGRTWRTLSTQPGVTAFLDRTHAVSVDLSLARTFGVSDDAGRTWQTGSQPISLAGAPVEILPGRGLVGGPFFLDPSDGWWFGSLPVAGQPVLCRTLDGGRTWFDLTPAGVVSDPQTSLQLQTAFVDELRGALVVGPEQPDAWPSVLVTQDGGRTWAPVAPAWPPASVPPGQGSIVVPTLVAYERRLVLELDLVVDRSSGPSTVRGHVLSISDDGGLTWGSWATMPSTSTDGAGMAVDGAGTFLLADGRRLWSSSDFGRTWHSRLLTGLAGGLLSVIAAADGSLFAVAQSGPAGAATLTLARSRDGGGQWTEIRLPPEP
jgi:photosystem II stability/assembly factor-like uncharacterized protein